MRGPLEPIRYASDLLWEQPAKDAVNVIAASPQDNALKNFFGFMVLFYSYYFFIKKQGLHCFEDLAFFVVKIKFNGKNKVLS